MSVIIGVKKSNKGGTVKSTTSTEKKGKKK